MHAHYGWPSWSVRIASELSLNAWTQPLHVTLNAIYGLLLKDTHSDYGIILEPPEPIKPCLYVGDGEALQDDQQLYLEEVCNSPRICTTEQLKLWLTEGITPSAKDNK